MNEDDDVDYRGSCIDCGDETGRCDCDADWYAETERAPVALPSDGAGSLS